MTSSDEATDPQEPQEHAGQETFEEAMEVELETFDLDHDGKVSFVEDVRAEIGIVDARLEEIADEGGLKGKLAEGAHKVLDKLDND